MIAATTEKHEKRILREEMNRKRNAMTEAEAESKSMTIATNLTKIKEYKEARAVIFYASKGNEVRTEKLIRNALKEGKKALLPITDTEREELELSEIKDYDSDLIKGAFGIMEPKHKKAFDEAQIDAAIVPGLAFDKRGHRLGYGHGFYDKLLKRLHAVKIGLAYDFQVVNTLPAEAHDQLMDLIVTESRIIRCR